MEKIPEPVNQTYFGVVLGGIGFYFSILLFWIVPVLFGYFLIILSGAYLFYMIILSCIQMYKNTRRYWIKEMNNKDKWK
ncbi:hypothetical protein M0R72_03530 [Candidatus Pacearchaeota archaeon]|jgi:cytochrome b subunit of formate dehydrogenase|nr:hypothetical protein [Candidatus Pacearchaeota archaeon]